MSTNQSDSSAPNNGKAIVAKPGDIICGRGFHIANHRGNLNFHLIVNKYRDEYLSSKRPHKTRITKHVLKEIKASGARFIRSVSDKNNVDRWEEVDHATAYKKVSHALRLRTKNESNGGSISAEDAPHGRVTSTAKPDPQIPSSQTTLRNLPTGQYQIPRSATLPGVPLVASSAHLHHLPSALAPHTAAEGALPSQLPDPPPLSQVYREVYWNTLRALKRQSEESDSL
eukprot:CAMPEP_0113640304 /NCGR_PEP_ID=MMETSP0017_2-20120614/21152_1 /TAXON_ID=2856 /ORGANISM="Cylindrotheca closterium" /LENGTH=227 /DNA_ID=CAMNT_0000551577 /DNA_START=60 /DNA_END=743 /DNA_ORIENTATION=- /assembly_acc=CAM_ASM_000147